MLPAQLGAKCAKAQPSKDLAHQDPEFPCSAARGGPEQEAPGLASYCTMESIYLPCS